jgi:hypothetical protein
MVPKETTEAELLKEALEIDDGQIKAEFIRLPADMAYWNARYSDAILAHLRAKWAAETAEGECYIAQRERLEAEGKVTEKKIESAVATDPMYVAARNAEIEAEAERARLRGVVEAIATKRDMLMSLGAYIREEMRDPLIRDPRH